MIYNKLNKAYLKIIIIAAIIIVGLMIALYLQNKSFKKQLYQSKTEALSTQKKQFETRQKQTLDSTTKIIINLKENLLIEQQKPPVKIPFYNEKIIYVPVSDSTIYNTFTRERRKYLQKISE